MPVSDSKHQQDMRERVGSGAKCGSYVFDIDERPDNLKDRINRSVN